jgi:hypothetical protein
MKSEFLGNRNLARHQLFKEISLGNVKPVPRKSIFFKPEDAAGSPGGLVKQELLSLSNLYFLIQ